MYKRILPQVVLVLATILLTTLFQPLSHLQTLAQAQTGCQTFKETGHTLCGKFLTYWQQHGGLAQQGFPISEPFNEKSDLNGQTYQVQYFERAVFEAHPENAAPNDVLLSQLGTFQARSKYGNPPQFPGTGTPPPPPASAPAGVNTPLPLAREGVTIEFTGGDFGSCGGKVIWYFRIKNTSKAPFDMVASGSSLNMTDDTGKTYKPTDCGGGPLRDAFSNPTTVSPGGQQTGSISFDVTGTPPSATYYDIKLTVSGTPLTFRYPLK